MQMFMELNTHTYKHMQTQDKTNATSSAQNTNKPQPTHATHNLITSKGSKMLQLFEVDHVFHKSYVGSEANPIHPVMLTNTEDTRKWEKPFYCTTLKLTCYLGNSNV